MFSLAMNSAWKVLYTALLLGAGIPATFALGVRGTAMAGGGMTDGRRNGAGRVLAIICFALVALAVATGLTMIIATGFGKAVSFSHIYPTIITPKK